MFFVYCKKMNCCNNIEKLIENFAFFLTGRKTQDCIFVF